MLPEFSAYRRHIHSFLTSGITSYSSARLLRFSPDVYRRLVDGSLRGKVIRGSLILAIVEQLSGKISKDAIATAAALEIFQTAILAHDDIIDDDALRRGVPTLSRQYRQLGEKTNVIDIARYGTAQALVAGDIGFFIAYSMIAATDLPAKTQIALIRKLSEEFILVGLGQMEDVAITFEQSVPSEQEVLAMYQYKTARYTFSLPLALGCILAGAKKETQQRLERIGEYIGIIFQIRDDELSLFGTTAVTGKQVGNDIAENKKTLYWLKLFAAADKVTSKKLNDIFGNTAITKKDIAFVRQQIALLGIDRDVDQMKNAYIEKAHQTIEKLPSKNLRSLMTSLVEFVIMREK